MQERNIKKIEAMKRELEESILNTKLAIEDRYMASDNSGGFGGDGGEEEIDRENSFHERVQLGLLDKVAVEINFFVKRIDTTLKQTNFIADDLWTREQELEAKSYKNKLEKLL